MFLKFIRIIGFVVLISLMACETVREPGRQLDLPATAVSPPTPPLTATLENTAVSQSSPTFTTVIATTTKLPTVTEVEVTVEHPFPERNATSETATPTPVPTAIPVTFPSYECPIDPPPPAPATPVADINVAYVGSDGIYYWQEATGQSELIFAADGVKGLQMSDDGQRIAFMQKDDDVVGRMSLWVMDSDGQNGRILLNEADFLALHEERETVVIRPLQITWVPNSHTLAFSTIRYSIVDGYIEGITAHVYDDLQLIDSDSGDLTTLLPAGAGGNFSYSPDGAHIAIVNDSSLSLVDSVGSNLRPNLVTWKPLGITHDYHRPQPAWLPDSHSLLIAPSNAKDNMDAFYNPNASSTIWQVLIDGTAPHQLATMVGAPLWLGFSPDRSQVLFARRIGDDLTHELHIATVDNGVHTVYASAEGMVGGGDWLPDGSGFVFRVNRELPQIGRLCQPPIPFTLPETPDSFVRYLEWVGPSRFLFTIDEPPQLLLSDLNGDVTPIGSLRHEYFFSIGALTAFDFSQ